MHWCFSTTDNVNKYKILLELQQCKYIYLTAKLKSLKANGYVLPAIEPMVFQIISIALSSEKFSEW